MVNLLTPGKVGEDVPRGDNEEYELDDEDLAVLREAGVLPPATSKGKGRKSTGRTLKHVIFVSSDKEGEHYVSRDKS